MIKDKIQKQILICLKRDDKTELKVLRYILSEIKYEEIKRQRDLTDDEVIALLQKEVKKREEAIILFKKSGRDELVKDEEKQIDVIKNYLPKYLSEEEISRIVDEVILNLPEVNNTGKIIGLVMMKVKGRADGSLVSRIVREKLTVKTEKL